jgi:hypothetical protein
MGSHQFSGAEDKLIVGPKRVRSLGLAFKEQLGIKASPSEIEMEMGWIQTFSRHASAGQIDKAHIE